MVLDHLAVELGVRQAGGILFWIKIFKIFFWSCHSSKALICIRLAQHFDRTGHKRLARRMALSLRREFASFVSPKAEIGPGLRLPHPTGIVIGEGVRIGSRVTIYQQVTLGGQRSGDWAGGRYPQVGDDVTLFSGARLLGAMTVGDRAIVGANAVVLRDVPEDHVAIGIPASVRPGRAERSRISDAAPLQTADLVDSHQAH